MNLEEYEAYVAALRQAVWNDNSIGFDDYTVGRISSNLLHLSPNIENSQYDALIKNIFLNQTLASYDLGCSDYLVPNIINDDQSLDYSFESSPAIICSYHYGSYRLLGPHFLKKGVKLSILIDHRVDNVKGQDFRDALDNSCRATDVPTTMYRMRNTADTALLRKLLHDLRDGYSLLIYIDGNVGTNSDKGRSGKDEHLVGFNFMDCPLLSRFGFAMLGYLSKCPILPVMLRRQDKHNVVRCYPVIKNSGMSRDVFCQEACAAVWLHLEHALRVDPTQWESWRCIDLSVDISRLKERFGKVNMEFIQDVPLIFNLRRYALSNKSGTPVLYDRAEYRIIPINSKVYDALIGCSNGLMCNESDMAFVKNCFDLDILVPKEDVRNA